MTFFKRIFLFLVTNLAVLVVISVILGVLSMFGVRFGNGTGGLLVYSAIVGFAGSIISLLMSKWLALRSVGAVVIRQPRNETEIWLFDTVSRLAGEWKLKMPELAVYDSPEPNAFASGASRNRSVVAVSTGLLHSMTRDEVEAVLAHEMAHVGNGDMVTLALIQGVVNTFVIFLSRIVANVIASDRNNSGLIYFAVNMVLQVVFGLLASMVVMWFSRQREYRADAGSAKHVGADKMIAALKRLGGSEIHSGLPQEMNALGIAGGKDGFFSTHPTLENRIARLQARG